MTERKLILLLLLLGAIVGMGNTFQGKPYEIALTPEATRE